MPSQHDSSLELVKYSNGALPHDALMASIELYGTRVLPRVRKLLAGA